MTGKALPFVAMAALLAVAVPAQGESVFVRAREGFSQLENTAKRVVFSRLLFMPRSITSRPYKLDVSALAIAATLWFFVTKYRSHRVHTMRPIVEQIMLYGGSDHTGGKFWPHCKLFVI